MRVNLFFTRGLLAALLVLFVTSVSSQAQTTATRLAPATPAAFPVGLGPEGVAPDDAAVYVANQDSSDVTQFARHCSLRPPSST